MRIDRGPISRQEYWIAAYVLAVAAGAFAVCDFELVGLVLMLCSLIPLALALRAEGLLERFSRKDPR